MKRFFDWIPNKWKGIYIIWLTIHSIIILLITDSRADRQIWVDLTNYFLPSIKDDPPFVNWDSFNIEYYDITEFLIYTIVPILIALVIYFFKQDRKRV